MGRGVPPRMEVADHEYLVGTSEGIISCTTMRRLQDDLAYDKACLDEINVGYRDFVCKGAMIENPRMRMAVRMLENRDQAPITGQSVPRRMRIAPRDLQEHGYTIGCPGCEAVQSGKDLKRNHTEDCRNKGLRLNWKRQKKAKPGWEMQKPGSTSGLLTPQRMT